MFNFFQLFPSIYFADSFIKAPGTAASRPPGVAEPTSRRLFYCVHRILPTPNHLVAHQLRRCH